MSWRGESLGKRMGVTQPLGAFPRIPYEAALRREIVMRVYKREWRACQRCKGIKLLVPTLFACWLTWMLFSVPDMIAKTDLFVQVLLAAPAAGFAVTTMLSLFWPMALFSLMHPEPRGTKGQGR